MRTVTDSEFMLGKLRTNASDMDIVQTRIEEISSRGRLTLEDYKQLEDLYRSEFKLAMQNSGIFEDLMSLLENDNEFVRKRFSDEAKKLLRVGIISA